MKEKKSFLGFRLFLGFIAAPSSLPSLRYAYEGKEMVNPGMEVVWGVGIN